MAYCRGESSTSALGGDDLLPSAIAVVSWDSADVSSVAPPADFLPVVEELSGVLSYRDPECWCFEPFLSISVSVKLSLRSTQLINWSIHLLGPFGKISSSFWVKKILFRKKNILLSKLFIYWKKSKFFNRKIHKKKNFLSENYSTQKYFPSIEKKIFLISVFVEYQIENFQK